METVSMAYAKANLPELVERVSHGERIAIVRYKKPVAELGPSAVANKLKRKLGTGKGKVSLADLRALAPMTDAEVESFVETGSY